MHLLKLLRSCKKGLMDDYRNTEYCQKFENIKNKKEELKNKILEKHPNLTNFYKIIRDKDGGFKNAYLQIYNNKCVYCGNSLDNISIDLMEIDHYINKASFDGENDAHQIANLLPACQMCNRGKAGLTITNDYISILHPEGDILPRVFLRDEKYNIYISEKYAKDPFINEFYNKLSFGRETRRLDFLLLKMRGLCSKLDKRSEVKSSLLEIINELQMRRNRLY